MTSNYQYVKSAERVEIPEGAERVDASKVLYIGNKQVIWNNRRWDVVGGYKSPDGNKVMVDIRKQNSVCKKHNEEFNEKGYCKSCEGKLITTLQENAKKEIKPIVRLAVAGCEHKDIVEEWEVPDFFYNRED